MFKSLPGCIASIAAFAVFAVIYAVIASTIPNSVALNAASATNLKNPHVISSSIWFAPLLCSGDEVKTIRVTGTNIQGVAVTVTVCATFWRTAKVMP